MNNKIPPPIVTLFFGLCIFYSKEYFPQINAMGILSLISFVAGIYPCLSCVQDTTVNPISIEKASSLVVSGIFKYSRNPMYLGMVLILLKF
jgi:protein-S-isoprenylcysteine O-methyltransferase Ste14